MVYQSLFLFYIITGTIFSCVTFGKDLTEINKELRRIFHDNEFRTEGYGPVRWLEEGAFYTTLEKSDSENSGRDLVRCETSSGDREILVSASHIKPEGYRKALEISEYDWSKDRTKLLIFANTKRVWRRNTRGDYWILDLASRSLQKLGGEADESSLMFAKFSPDGSRVAYVSKNNLYVENLSDSRITALTTDGSESFINGTSDWVYEEEFGLRDGFRWSPDGKKIAFWNFDSSGVGNFALINNTDQLYPTITNIPYPKVGTTNSAVRIGVISIDGGDVVWINLPGDPRNNYVPRMDWANNSGTLILQYLNRLQNQNDVLLISIDSGQIHPVFRDQSDSWVEIMDQFTWVNKSSELLWLSEKNGWRHAYALGLDQERARIITQFEADAVSLAGSDKDQGWSYFIASPEKATERYLFRSRYGNFIAPPLTDSQIYSYIYVS